MKNKLTQIIQPGSEKEGCFVLLVEMFEMLESSRLQKPVAKQKLLLH